LPLTLRRLDGDGRSRTDIFLVASEALVRLSYIPVQSKRVQCGRVESNHHSTRRQGYSLLSSPFAPRPHGVRVAGRARTGACGDHNPGCFRLHHGHHVDDYAPQTPVAPQAGLLQKKTVVSEFVRTPSLSRSFPTRPTRALGTCRSNRLNDVTRYAAVARVSVPLTERIWKLMWYSRKQHPLSAISVPRPPELIRSPRV
jgi:hypothetical protein